MHKHAFETPIGKLDFDEKGDLKSFKFVVYEWHKDGIEDDCAVSLADARAPRLFTGGAFCSLAPDSISDE